MAGRGKTPAFLQLQALKGILQNANSRGTAAAEMSSFTLFYESEEQATVKPSVQVPTSCTCGLEVLKL